MPLTLLVLSTVPVRLSVRNTSYLLYPFFHPTTKWGGGYNEFALSRPSVRLHYRVRSINPKPIEGFSSNLAAMFASSRGCAEPMLPICQLNVKVTIEGQISNNQILDIMSCPLC